MGVPGSTVVKKMPASAGDAGWIPGAGRSPGEGNGNPLEYSCLENSIGKRAWQAIVHAVAKESDMTSNNNKTSIFKGLSLLRPNLQLHFPF